MTFLDQVCDQVHAAATAQMPPAVKRCDRFADLAVDRYRWGLVARTASGGRAVLFMTGAWGPGQDAVDGCGDAERSIPGAPSRCPVALQVERGPVRPVDIEGWLAWAIAQQPPCGLVAVRRFSVEPRGAISAPVGVELEFQAGARVHLAFLYLLGPSEQPRPSLRWQHREHI